MVEGMMDAVYTTEAEVKKSDGGYTIELSIGLRTMRVEGPDVEKVWELYQRMTAYSVMRGDSVVPAFFGGASE
jgi:hypothetical protein